MDVKWFYGSFVKYWLQFSEDFFFLYFFLYVFMTYLRFVFDLWTFMELISFYYSSEFTDN